MRHATPAIIFVFLSLLNIGAGFYVRELWKEVQDAGRKVALLGPLYDNEAEQRQDIESLVKTGSQEAVDRLLRYGKMSKTKAGVFEAITGVKRLDTPYANKKLQELIREEKAAFAQEMALAAYRMYGSKEDVELLQSVQKDTKSLSTQDKLAKLIEFLKTKNKGDRGKKFAFIETRAKQ